MQVMVRDNNVDQALRALKKKLQREGVFREVKLRQHFEKPSVKKARERAEAVVRVSEASLVRALGLLVSRMKIVVEPTGALAAAAVLDGGIPADARRIGVVLSGGNVDPATLSRLIGGGSRA